MIQYAETFQKFIKFMLIMFHINTHIALSDNIFYLFSHLQEIVDFKYSFNDFIQILMFMYH